MNPPENPPQQHITSKLEQLTIADLGRLLWKSNALYLVSAAFALYASTILFDTNNIWMESGIPVAILAGYTALCAVTAAFIVRHGKVWDDAQSLSLIVLALPLALSASLDDKLIDRPTVGLIWMGGGFCVVAGISYWLSRRIGLALGRRNQILIGLQLFFFFLWPFVLSQLLRQYPGDRIPAIRGIVLFPWIFAILLLPLWREVRHAALARPNGTPWKYALITIFALYTLAAMIRTYLLSISFYGGRGVGGYLRMETGFGLWMLLPLFLVVLIFYLEHALNTGKIRNGWIVAAVGAAGMGLFCRLEVCPENRLSLLFFRSFWGEHTSTGLPALLGAGMLFVYLGIRRQYWAWLLPGIGLLELVRRNFGKELLTAMSTESILTLLGMLIGGALFVLAWQKRHWSTTALFLGYLVALSFLAANRHWELPEPPYLLLLGISGAALLTGWIWRHREMELFGLTLLTALFIPAIFWHAGNFTLRYFLYLVGIYGVTLIFLRHRHWIPTALQTLMLLIWLVMVISGQLNRLPWRGAGVIFVSLVLFLAAFLISLGKAGILQRHWQTLYRRLQHLWEK